MTTKKSVTFFLFDTKCEQYRWFGKSIWLNTYIHINGDVLFIFSGGIQSYSANAPERFSHPRLAGYDLNSRFETKPGKKIQSVSGHFKQLKSSLKNSNVMNRINQLFNSNKKDILSIYFCAGNPTLDGTANVIRTHSKTWSGAWLKSNSFQWSDGRRHCYPECRYPSIAQRHVFKTSFWTIAGIFART